MEVTKESLQQIAALSLSFVKSLRTKQVIATVMATIEEKDINFPSKQFVGTSHNIYWQFQDILYLYEDSLLPGFEDCEYDTEKCDDLIHRYAQEIIGGVDVIDPIMFLRHVRNHIKEPKARAIVDKARLELYAELPLDSID